MRCRRQPEVGITRGYGETTAKWSDYSARAVGRDAIAVLKHLGVGPATILGNSFAAGSALWAAQDAPEQVNGVVLLGPIVRDLEVSFVQKLALGVGFAGPWRVGFWTMYWDSLFPTKKPVDHAEVKAAITRNLREPGRMDALRAMIGLSKAYHGDTGKDQRAGADCHGHQGPRL
ncbi:alpha/beta fold hydrolase [Neorhizobium lilium]|uniref:alpha/beta fold hydrolase n=1 Tax=Neorhizobium lilium TaxID=2503024 RepID=UPI0019803B3D|nr:alpha/beta hydrolase [Neorhizobium lilium]